LEYNKLKEAGRKIMEKKFEIRIFSGLDTYFDQALLIRTKVFVEEQNVPIELERDEFDATAVHALVFCDARAVATGRMFPDPAGAATLKLGRVAVLKEFRGHGAGKAVISELLRVAAARKDVRQILIHAQKAVVGWYEALGFSVCSDEFLEAGIVHQEMVLRLS